MSESDPGATFGYLAEEMAKRGIAFIFARESQEEPRLGPMIKNTFGGPFVANQGLSFEQGEQLIGSGEADLISWGVQYIANPDLTRRYEIGAELNKPNMATFLGFDLSEEGYLDYPVLDA